MCVYKLYNQYTCTARRPQREENASEFTKLCPKSLADCPHFIITLKNLLAHCQEYSLLHVGLHTKDIEIFDNFLCMIKCAMCSLLYLGLTIIAVTSWSAVCLHFLATWIYFIFAADMQHC